MRKRKVLFACADADTIDRVTKGLEDFGYEVVSCTRGETALELVGKNHVDIAILAIELIGFNGFEICRKLRVRFSDATLPIVIYASRDSRQWRLTAFECGANSFSFEPLLFDRLDSVIRSLLRFKVNLENSIPITDALSLLDRAYATPGPVQEVRVWPRGTDIEPIVRYCYVLLEARTMLNAKCIEETVLLLRLVLHMAAYLGSAAVVIEHLDAISRGTGIEEVVATLARRMAHNGAGQVEYFNDDFRSIIESLLLLMGLSERMFCDEEDPMEALRRMRADGRNYDEGLLLALESIVSKDEFLSSIFG